MMCVLFISVTLVLLWPMGGQGATEGFDRIPS
jgi:hypothetical protein